MHGVTGQYFDRRGLDDCFPESHLDSFVYVQGHRYGFEIRDHHLETLIAGLGSRLRKLILLGSSRLTSSVITSCLQILPTLEYFAISIIAVHEWRSNFSLALPQTVSVLKIQITQDQYSVPPIADDLETGIMCRPPLPEAMYINICNPNKGRQGNYCY
jgi:hypothetical protein